MIKILEIANWEYGSFLILNGNGLPSSYLYDIAIHSSINNHLQIKIKKVGLNELFGGVGV